MIVRDPPSAGLRRMTSSATPRCLWSRGVRDRRNAEIETGVCDINGIESPRTGALPMLVRLWTWLTTCAENDCLRRPVRIGWCGVHTPAYDPGPDEYWGDTVGSRR
jgi:hypothetical protein